MSRQQLLIVGAGMAAMRAVEDLIDRAPDAFAITIVGAEPRPAYNRILLSPVLSGEKAFDDIVTHDDAWFADNGVTYISGVRVDAVDRADRTATLSDGRVLNWDRLLLATGSDPIIIPIPGHDLPGVVPYRDLDDVDAMIAAGACNALVIGGGLLGLEAAAGLAARGAKTTVLHLMPWVMERQLDESAGALLKADLERKGVEVVVKADTAGIEGDGQVERVLLKDGRSFDVDIVVMAVGIRPNVALAKTMGLEVERGIVVDDFMTTSDPAVFAVGECVQHRGVCYGLVAPLYESAKSLADRLAGIETAGYQGSALSTRLKVTGVDLFSAGDFSGGPGTEDLVFRDAGRNVYKRLVVKDDVLIGAVLYGECADGGWYFDLIREGADIADIRDVMIFGRAFAEGTPADPKAAVAALPDASEICGCNGVCKGTIVQAIAEKGLTTLDDVKAQTKASASCGSCAGLVTSLLEVYAGVELAESADPPICKCTNHGHDHVRAQILERRLKSIPDV
ncbi:MAG: FAD-dependent oxidoreductase, partial [Pseudomonadota bacterium]